MKNLFIIAVIVAVIALGSFVFKSKMLGSTDFNRIETMGTQSATTTHTSLPVKVLSNNTGRTYAYIANDSDTAVYLYFGNFASNLAASTTVSANSGVRLNATGGSYEITDKNLFVGEVWASSTAASKKIIFIEK